MSWRALAGGGGDVGRVGDEQLCNLASVFYTLPCYSLLFQIAYRIGKRAFYLLKDAGGPRYGRWEGWRPGEEGSLEDGAAGSDTTPKKNGGNPEKEKLTSERELIDDMIASSMKKKYRPWQGWRPPMKEEQKKNLQSGEVQKTRKDTRRESSGPLKWPYSWNKIFSHKSIFAVYVGFLLAGYAAFQALSECKTRVLCVPVEEQNTQEIMYHIMEMLGRGTMIFWLAGVPHKVAYFGPLAMFVMGVLEYFNCQLFFYACEIYLPHSASSDVELNNYAYYIGGSVAFAGVSIVVEGCSLLTRRSKIHFVVYVCIIVCFHVGVSVATEVHWHHYHTSFVFALFCIFPTTISGIMFVKCMMLFIDGLGLWGADPNFLDEDFNYRAEGSAKAPDDKDTFRWNMPFSFGLIVCALVSVVLSLLRKRKPPETPENLDLGSGSPQKDAYDVLPQKDVSGSPGLGAESAGEESRSKLHSPIGRPKPKAKRGIRPNMNQGVAQAMAANKALTAFGKPTLGA